MRLYEGLRVLQIGNDRAGAFFGRIFSDLGAQVTVADLSLEEPLPGAFPIESPEVDAYLSAGKRPAAFPTSQISAALGDFDVAVLAGYPSRLRAAGLDPEQWAAIHPSSVVVAISPFGWRGPRSNEPVTDLTLMAASGIARILTGQVDDLDEPPRGAVGEQASCIAALAAASASAHQLLGLAGSGRARDPSMKAAGNFVDVSAQEALATLAIQELTRAGRHQVARGRLRTADGNGATVTILPASDGYAAISPREDHQWQSWLAVMGLPDWGNEVRFRTKPDRVANWDDLHEKLSEWSRTRTRRQIAEAAQAAHVPSFPLLRPSEHLDSEQLKHRGFFASAPRPNAENCAPALKVPKLPVSFGPSRHSTIGARGEATAHDPASVPAQNGLTKPLAGVRVLDFSWVIAGPTATRFLAAMGAEVIKVEAPGRGDPGRTSELHSVLGEGKQGVVLDLKLNDGQAVARELAEASDVLIENFATGVMERFGLGSARLCAENPKLVYVSASGLGRSGPEKTAVAYGTLLQCYSGFAALNSGVGRAPRVGMAWLDPMCGLFLAALASAGVWRQRRTGQGLIADVSMIESMLWTLPGIVIDDQLGRLPSVEQAPVGHGDPAGVRRGLDGQPSLDAMLPASGEDSWIAVSVRGEAEWRALCELVPALDAGASDDLNGTYHALCQWSRDQDPERIVERLAEAKVASSAVASALDLVTDPHLKERGFWWPESNRSGGRDAPLIPGLPWSFNLTRPEPSPALGEHTESVLSRVLGYSAQDVARLRSKGVFG